MEESSIENTIKKYSGTAILVGIVIVVFLLCATAVTLVALWKMNIIFKKKKEGEGEKEGEVKKEHQQEQQQPKKEEEEKVEAKVEAPLSQPMGFVNGDA